MAVPQAVLNCNIGAMIQLQRETLFGTNILVDVWSSSFVTEALDVNVGEGFTA